MYSNSFKTESQTKPPPKVTTLYSLNEIVCKKNFKKKQPKGERRSVDKKSIVPPQLWMEKEDDVYWPPIPGLDAPMETATEPVGNIWKPPPRDPEEEEKYKRVYVPSRREMYEEFVLGYPPGEW